MGFGLFLLDSETSTINKLDQKKRLRLDKLDKVFFDLQVVPLFGDMQIAPFNYVKSSKTFDPSRWPLSSSSAISPQVNTWFFFNSAYIHIFVTLQCTIQDKLTR
jgi:cytoplasmic FMR1 interacting protein